jgi:hypothetical protein
MSPHIVVPGGSELGGLVPTRNERSTIRSDTTEITAVHIEGSAG